MELNLEIEQEVHSLRDELDLLSNKSGDKLNNGKKEECPRVITLIDNGDLL